MQLPTEHVTRYAKIIGVFLLILFVLHVSTIVLYGHRDRVQKADMIVVFGNRIEEDGSPSNRLKARLDRAIELYQNGQSQLLFLSGGVGKEGYDEADVMERYVVQHNIPKDDIIKDHDGTDTQQTALHVKQYLAENDLHSALAVSSYYHVPRIKLYFKKIGIKPVYTAHSRYYELRDLYSIPRKVIGVYVYTLTR